jgi:hypothetical protein
LIGVPEDSVKTIADQGGGGFMARDKQRDRRIDQFRRRKLVALGLGGDELAEQIFAPPTSLLLDQIAELSANSHDGILAAPEYFNRRLVDSLVCDNIISPGFEEVAIGFRNTQNRCQYGDG